MFQKHLSLISSGKNKVLSPINGKIKKGFLFKKTPLGFLSPKFKNIYIFALS